MSLAVYFKGQHDLSVCVLGRLYLRQKRPFYFFALGHPLSWRYFNTSKCPFSDPIVQLQSFQGHPFDMRGINGISGLKKIDQKYTRKSIIKKWIIKHTCCTSQRNLSLDKRLDNINSSIGTTSMFYYWFFYYWFTSIFLVNFFLEHLCH